VKKRVFSVLYMFCLTLLFTGAVSAVKTGLDDRIRINEELKRKSIVLGVLGLDTARSSDETLTRYELGVTERSLGGRTVYEGRGPDGEITGYAFEVSGPGFWGPIRAMAAVDKNGSRLLGVDFYRHTETPGLGARMTEPWFRGQFAGLPLTRTTGAFFRLVPPGTGEAPGDLDAITGATQTSMAIERFLNRELADVRKTLIVGEEF